MHGQGGEGGDQSVQESQGQDCDSAEQIIGDSRFQPRVHQLHVGRDLQGFLRAAKRQHHQRSDSWSCRSGGLHQPEGSSGLRACGAGQGVDQKRHFGGTDRMFADRFGQGRVDEAGCGGNGR